jgi:transcriptional regulator with XRE-family HTH domain
VSGHAGLATGGSAAIPGRESRRGARCATNLLVVTVAEPAGFAGALRAWRERRRVSQLELALRAGTTQRHVSFIERGRSLPGRGMVVRLAEALDVPLRERNELLLAAGFAPAYPETSLHDPALDPIRIALEHVLDGHLPYPAVLTDRDAQLIAGNRAVGALLTGAAPGLLEAPVNLARVLLHPEGIAPRIGNLTEWGWHVIDGLARKADRDGNRALEALIAELREYVPARPRHVPPGHLGFAVPLRLRAGEQDLALLTTLAHFATAVDVEVAELTLEAFLPADAATTAYFARASRSAV